MINVCMCVCGRAIGYVLPVVLNDTFRILGAVVLVTVVSGLIHGK